MFSLLLVVFTLTNSSICSVLFPEFSDKLLYDISWNGPLSDEQSEAKNMKESVVITTNNDEKYQCLLPKIQQHSDDNFNVDDGPNPESLMSGVLSGPSQKCSYRLEPYWTYEICHGKSILQYHEEKDNDGKVKRDEFSLGKMTQEEVSEILAGPKPIDRPTGENRKVPTKLLDEKETPYFSVEMSNGTPCDLSGQPRKSKVIYVCHLAANNDVISVKEVTTCEYEIVVLTNVLCGNPAYKLKSDPINDIQCHAIEGSPSMPVKLREHYEQSDVMKMKIVEESHHESKTETKHEGRKPIDEALNRNFLEGKYCLTGGTGWWKYELCNGKHVNQFHVESNKKKTVINLGKWDKKEHLQMVKNGKIKPKGKKNVLHWYSNGEICDLTGKPRTAVVNLVCMKGSGQQIAIYMTEPTPCHYTLGVESPILCPFVENADDNGLFDQML